MEFVTGTGIALQTAARGTRYRNRKNARGRGGAAGVTVRRLRVTVAVVGEQGFSPCRISVTIPFILRLNRRVGILTHLGHTR